ncbi:MAG: hypothetical protein AAFQ82_13035, partial [Myxococcota bacterium]
MGLDSNGAVQVHAVRVKPIRWNQPSDPFSAAHHLPDAQQQGWRPRVDSVLDDSVQGGASVERVIPDSHRHEGALVVTHPGRSAPFVVSLAWGQPGEGGGDVADRW